MVGANEVCDGVISNGDGEIRQHVDVGNDNVRTVRNALAGREDADCGLGCWKRPISFLLCWNGRLPDCLVILYSSDCCILWIDRFVCCSLEGSELCRYVEDDHVDGARDWIN